MTYTTPSPPGVPDFATAQLQPGQNILSQTFTAFASLNSNVGYCGNVPSVFLMVGVSGTGTDYSLTVQWSNSNVAGSPLFGGDVYRFNPAQGLTIVDCLPVLGQYMYLTATRVSGGGNATFVVTATTALQSVRGTPLLYNNGVCMTATTVVAHGTTSLVYGSYLSPGIYSYSVDSETAPGSCTVTLYGYNSTGVAVNQMLLVFNPTTTQTISGLVVVGNCQPVFSLNNGAAAASWTVETTLTGPQV